MSFAEKYGAEPFTFNDEAGQIVWPVHCVQGTEGAELHPELDTKPVRFIVRKGMNPGIDSYSAFLENDKNTQTGLFSLLEKAKEVYVCGIALDVCVFNTAMDALKGGFRSVTVITDASAAVAEEGGKKACA